MQLFLLMSHTFTELSEDLFWGVIRNEQLENKEVEGETKKEDFFEGTPKALCFSFLINVNFYAVMKSFSSSGQYYTELTLPRCPWNVKIGSCFVRSMSFAVESSDPVNSFMLS